MIVQTTRFTIKQRGHISDDIPVFFKIIYFRLMQYKSLHYLGISDFLSNFLFLFYLSFTNNCIFILNQNHVFFYLCFIVIFLKLPVVLVCIEPKVGLFFCSDDVFQNFHQYPICKYTILSKSRSEITKPKNIYLPIGLPNSMISDLHFCTSNNLVLRKFI